MQEKTPTLLATEDEKHIDKAQMQEKTPTLLATEDVRYGKAY